MEYTSTQIIDGLREKNPAIIRHLYRQHASMIAGHVRKNNGSDEDAAEIIQITMLQLWTAVQEGRYAEEGKLERYIFKLAANNWRYELRRRRNRPTSSLDKMLVDPTDDSTYSLEAAIVKDRYLNAVHEALGEMESPCNEIIRLYHLKDISLQEISKQMNYDYNNLRKRIFDCRKKLKKLTEEILSNLSAGVPVFEDKGTSLPGH